MVCLLILVAWGVSSSGWYASYVGENVKVGIYRGRLGVKWRVWGDVRWTGQGSLNLQKQPTALSWPADLGLFSLPYLYRELPVYDPNGVLSGKSRTLMLPFWLLLLVVAIPILSLLWCKRSQIPNHGRGV
jgi:hypothetical protein